MRTFCSMFQSQNFRTSSDSQHMAKMIRNSGSTLEFLPVQAGASMSATDRDTLRRDMPARSRQSSILTVSYLMAAALYLYHFLFVPPFIPVETSPAGDWHFAANPAQMMVEQGALIYRDVFEFVMPGTTLVDALIFKVIGLRPWIPNVLSMLLGLGLMGLSLAISRRIMHLGVAMLPGALFLVSSFSALLDPVHHFYSLLAAMSAVAILMETRTTTRIAAAGALCGLSSCFTQTRGLAALAGIAVFLWWESRQRRKGWRVFLRDAAYLAGGFAAILLLVNGYFIWKAGVTRYFWCVFVFPVKYYPKQANWNSFMVIRDFTRDFDPHFQVDLHLKMLYVNGRKLFLLLTTPIVFGLFFVRYWLKYGKEPWELWARPMLVACVGLMMFLSITNSPSPLRMAVSSLPALILLGWLLDSPGKIARTLVAIGTVAVLLVALYSVIRLRPVVAGVIPTPDGRLAVLKAGLSPLRSSNEFQCSEYIWIEQHTRPGDYFYAPLNAEIYFYFDLLNPTPLNRIENNGYTTPEQVADVIRGLEEHHVRYIFWGPSDSLDTIPSWENPADAHLGPLREYIKSRYSVAQVFSEGPNGNDVIWERRAQ
jgi:hypothetical protein